MVTLRAEDCQILPGRKCDIQKALLVKFHLMGKICVLQVEAHLPEVTVPMRFIRAQVRHHLAHELVAREVQPFFILHPMCKTCIMLCFTWNFSLWAYIVAWVEQDRE